MEIETLENKTYELNDLVWPSSSNARDIEERKKRREGRTWLHYILYIETTRVLRAPSAQLSAQFQIEAKQGKKKRSGIVHNLTPSLSVLLSGRVESH